MTVSTCGGTSLRRHHEIINTVVHLLNARGNKVGQRDTGFYDHYFLCTGDQVITWYHLPRTADTIILRVGMYQFDSDQHVVDSTTIDHSGNPGLPWVDIPLS